jgi:Uma2 family endonuclease
MTTAALPAEQRFVLIDADWRTYESMLRTLEARHIFVTYSKGRLELMSPSWQHDNRSERIGQLIRTLAEHFDVPLLGGGSTTFRREDLDRGLEPDRCFYVQNAARILGKKKIDLSVDPPPDLCVEVEISQRILDRIDIYANLGVPQLWRDDGSRLTVATLQPDRTYLEQQGSPTFPALTTQDLQQILNLGLGLDDTAWGRTARQWLRQHAPT